MGVSAWRAPVENIGLSKGQRILIHGGAGGIGQLQYSLPNWWFSSLQQQVQIQGICPRMRADWFNPTKPEFEDLLHDYDSVFDTVGGETYKIFFKVLKKGGILVSMLEQPNSD